MKETFRAVVIVLALAPILISGCSQPRSTKEGPQKATRIVSLSPAMTEVLFELGAWDLLVGRSDYCRYPSSLSSLPTGGTALTPNLEALVRMRPELIVAEGSLSVARATLEKIAPTSLLPWTTVEDVGAGIVALGELVGREDAAAGLVTRVRAALAAPVEPLGPRVLLLVGMGGASDTTFWFLKEDSLHGQALIAAGGKNAVSGEVTGAPSLGVEELLKVDPEVVIALIPDGVEAEPAKERYRKALSRFKMLRVVQEDSLGFLVGSKHMSVGPRIVDFVESLRGELKRLAGKERSRP